MAPDGALAWARVVRFAAAAAGRAEKNIKGAPTILDCQALSLGTILARSHPRLWPLNM